MKILQVLVCYKNHSSGYVSYFVTGYWRIFLQYAGNNTRRGSRQEAEYVVPSKLMLFCLEFEGQGIFWRIVLSFCKITVLYPVYRVVEEVYMKYDWGWQGGEEPILFTLWRQNEGGTDKTFSRPDAPL
jgi:hypothetical protein